MLTKDELKTYNRFNDPYLTEKDYLQEIILHAIYSNRESTRSFVFKGGTALSKFYNSDRFSEDLDFNIIRTGELPDRIEEVIEGIAGRLFFDAEFIEEPSKNKFGTIGAELGIKGPRYNGKRSSLQHIRLEVNTTSKMAHEPLQLPRHQAYSDIDEYIGTIMDKQEILSEKFRAIMSRKRRHKERDLYDINFLMQKGASPNPSEILKKLEDSNMEFSKTALRESIDSIKSTWDDLAPFVSHKLEDYANVKKNVITVLEAREVL